MDCLDFLFCRCFKNGMLITLFHSPCAGWGTHMLAGALAGISEHTVIYPVDAIKVNTRSRALRTIESGC